MKQIHSISTSTHKHVTKSHLHKSEGVSLVKKRRWMRSRKQGKGKKDRDGGKEDCKIADRRTVLTVWLKNKQLLPPSKSLKLNQQLSIYTSSVWIFQLIASVEQTAEEDSAVDWPFLFLLHTCHGHNDKFRARNTRPCRQRKEMEKSEGGKRLQKDDRDDLKLTEEKHSVCFLLCSLAVVSPP